uniref:AAA_28 domain-containing protein n=1 Tax=Macrostomum lignano TaxID=282301 RepID=A0A1I8JJT2_9PLAT
LYLCGAQSVGKTTLIRELNRRPELASLRIEVIDELKLVSRYLDMARQDRLDDDSSDRLKLYDRSGLDAVNYICTYLPHLSHRMLGEAAVKHLIDELPPQLPELQKYTENLRQLLEQRGIPRVDLPERDLDIRVQRVSELLLNRDGNRKELDD